MSKAPKVGDTVEVRWIDAQVVTEWEGVVAQLQPPTAMTYGRLVYADDAFVAVAHEIFMDGSCRQVTSIPRLIIKSLKTLQGGKT